MLVGALCIPRFPLACELAERADLRGLPALVATPDEQRVMAVSRAAEAYGLAPGQPLREALGFPDVAVIEGRPALYRDIAETILDALLNAVPEVEADPETGAWFVVLDGLRALYRTLGNLSRAMLGSVPAALEPRLGIASGKFPALAAAQTAAAAGYCFVEPGRTVEFLASQPLSVLPLSPEAQRRLRLIGIETLEVLGALPRSMLTAQLGPEGGRAWDLAHGDDPTPIRARARAERVIEHCTFDPPAVNREMIEVALEQALGRALRRPVMKERALRQVVLKAETERGAGFERAVTFKEPLAERDRLWVALKAVIERVEFPGPVAELKLELSELTPATGRQLQFPSARNRQREQLEVAMRQLKARYGYCPVSRIVEVEPWSRLPERRLALVDYAV